MEADVCYCLISRYPFLPLHFQILRAAVQAEVEEDRQGPREALRSAMAPRKRAAPKVVDLTSPPAKKLKQTWAPH